MKKNYIPILLAFAAYCGNSAAAQDVYVYKGEGLDPVSTLKTYRELLLPTHKSSSCSTTARVRTFHWTNWTILHSLTAKMRL